MIIRLAVTAGVLFLCYLFIVRPVLNKTDEAINSSGLEQISKTVAGLSSGLQRDIRQSLSAAQAHGSNPRRLIHCIQRANRDTRRIQRCTRRF